MSYGNYGRQEQNAYGQGNYGGDNYGNPYGSQTVTPARTHESAGYQASNPYGATQPSQDYGSSPPPAAQGYGGAPPAAAQPYGNAPASQGYGNTPQQGYGNASGQQSARVLSSSEYRSDISSIQTAIKTLSTQISEIATLHQNALSSTTTGPSAQLEHQVTQTQLLNSRIKDDIKRLEKDAVNTPSESERKIKQTQIGSVKNSFEGQLTAYRKEEEGYRRRYQEQIARQYRIVNPDADESEVREAANADWGNEGVFQSALKTNRSAQSTSVLSSVRARHNDIQNIEKTLIELSALFTELAAVVEADDQRVQQIDEHGEQTVTDLEGGNVHVGKAIKSARNTRKLKWWCLGIAILIIIVIVAAILIWYYVAGPGSKKNKSNASPAAPAATKRSMPMLM